MVGDAPILLQHLVTRGYLDRLALVFTHFEAVNAPDLDARAKREKVLEGLSTTIQGIATLPKGQRVLLERRPAASSEDAAACPRNASWKRRSDSEQRWLSESWH
jgi:hypothetical protein